MAIGAASASSSASAPIGHYGQRSSFGLSTNAPLLREEFLDVLAVGVEVDGHFAARFNLRNDLPHERRFSCARVSGDLNVVGFLFTANDKIPAGFAGL